MSSNHVANIADAAKGPAPVDPLVDLRWLRNDFGLKMSRLQILRAIKSVASRPASALRRQKQQAFLEAEPNRKSISEVGHRRAESRLRCTPTSSLGAFTFLGKVLRAASMNRRATASRF